MGGGECKSKNKNNNLVNGKFPNGCAPLGMEVTPVHPSQVAAFNPSILPIREGTALRLAVPFGRYIAAIRMDGGHFCDSTGFTKIVRNPVTGQIDHVLTAISKNEMFASPSDAAITGPRFSSFMRSEQSTDTISYTVLQVLDERFEPVAQTVIKSMGSYKGSYAAPGSWQEPRKVGCPPPKKNKKTNTAVTSVSK
jgi:hypothetical protein